MDVAKKTMAVHQVEINALKEKIDDELVKQKNYDEEIKNIQKMSIETKRNMNNTSNTKGGGKSEGPT